MDICEYGIRYNNQVSEREVSEIKNIGYYRGIFKVGVIENMDKKKLVVFLEDALTGTQKDGYKEVKKGSEEVILTRHCYAIRDKLFAYYLNHTLKGENEEEA